MAPVHRYRTTVRWTGNLGDGTRDYRGYSRDHTIEIEGRPPILATSGLSPRSDRSRHTPDELLVAALSSCHMLWYLHLCSQAGVVVEAYTDDAEGTLELAADGSGRFTSATLRPRVVLRAGTAALARRLHEEAHRRCFVANSVNFPVACEPTIVPASAVDRPA
ncbi:MAG TPA: OsmC family protein [Thermoplasmata archaeon]|nr:OsmC family protein [Thermoplasmata archaeon]